MEANQYKGHKTVIVPETKKELITRVKPNPPPSIARPKQPNELLADWLEKWSDFITDDEAVEELEILINQAGGWSL
jgi:hypothetical protein